ncbi:MAG: leucyl aminopeptidase [Chlamydiia bacterium]|nr:leucyl aminopeptidase [Chlamydiia bacterium]
MKVLFAPDLAKRKASELLLLPFWEGVTPAAQWSGLKLSPPVDFSGKAGEVCLHYPEKGLDEPRIACIGLGKKGAASDEQIRRAYAEAVKLALTKKIQKITVVPAIGFIAPVIEAVLLANYAFVVRKEAPPLLEEIQWIGVEPAQFQPIYTLIQGVHFARDLTNGNADDVNPRMLADTAKELLKQNRHLKGKVLDKKQIEAEGMGLFLAVNRASALDPFLIEVSYFGNPKSKEHIVLVGKGITYDTGGLSIKTTEGMSTMKADMAAAATVLATVKVAAELGLKVNITALAPVTENVIGSKSYKPGDVYRSMSGKTVEIFSTDAEGRLILADALTYAQKYLKPTCLIDLATLVGGTVIALGDDFSALYATEKKLAAALLAAADQTGERVWEMPLVEEYSEALKSDIADLRNSGWKEASSIRAALFLKEFVDTVPWAHLDIAGPAFLPKPKYYNPTKGTGYGVRLLVSFLQSRARA